MLEYPWTMTVLLHRQKGRNSPRLDKFTLTVNPDEYVLDVIERVWAFHDRSVCFQHACHHSVCGACGMRVNGVEKLTCITHVRDVAKDGGVVKVEPLRNFPVISDLVVDLGNFYVRMEQVGFQQVVPLNKTPPTHKKTIAADKSASSELERLVDCIECGMCISACPVPLTTGDYLGPAVLAAIQHRGLDTASHLLELADSPDGVWRCHSAFECTAVCPAAVEPAWRIMDLRKQVVKKRISNFFRA